MHEETGGPKNCRTKDADHMNRQTVFKEHDDEIELQDETIHKILTMLDQQILQADFGEEENVLEIDRTPCFSQSFKDNMRAMVAERLGDGAADRFVANTAHMYGQSAEGVSETTKRMSQTKPSALSGVESLDGENSIESKKEFEIRINSGKARKEAFFRWMTRAAVILVFVMAGFVYHKVGYVQATGLPDVDAAPEKNIEYSKVGSLKDIISSIDYTNYPLKVQQIYVPDKVIPGFYETDKIIKDTYVNIFYENSKNEWYQYRQITVGSSSFIDIEDGDQKEVEVGQWPGLYAYKDNTANLWWFDYNYAYHLQGTVSEEALIKVAESLIMEK